METATETVFGLIIVIEFVIIVYIAVRTSIKASEAEKRVFKQYGESDLKGAKNYISEVRTEREAKEVFMQPRTNGLDQSGTKQMDAEISNVLFQSMMNEDAPPRHEDHRDVDHSQAKDHSVHYQPHHDNSSHQDHSSFDHGSHSSDSSSYSSND